MSELSREVIRKHTEGKWDVVALTLATEAEALEARLADLEHG